MKSGAEQTRIGVVGPYQYNGPGKLPSVDWQMHMTPGDTTLSNSRIASSAEKAFVVYKGNAYEVPESDLASFPEARSEPARRLSDAGLADANAAPPDDASLDGEPFTRITGRFDPAAAAKDARSDGELRRVEATLRVKKDGQTATVKLTVASRT